jgi:hypothetical protein
MWQQINDAIVLPTELVEMAQQAVADVDKAGKVFNPDDLADLTVGERSAIAEVRLVWTFAALRLGAFV